MQHPLKRLVATSVVAAASFCAPAMAQTWTYSTFNDPNSATPAFGNTYSGVQDGIKLSVTAFGQGSATTFSTAYVGNYGTGSGFGVKNQTEGLNITAPQHSMDNSVGVDMLALHFTSNTSNNDVSLVLTQLATGWHNTSASSNCGINGTSTCGTDSDISLLRWTGAIGTAPVIAGKTQAQLLTAGWSLVNHYADMVDDTNRATGLSTGSTGSSWWLISAYSSAWGTGTNTANLSDGDDFVKVLSSVSTIGTNSSNAGVPEPGSLALAALALGGIFALRRRR